MRNITLVAAMGENRVIGVDGGMPWHLPVDFAHFKRVTTGHTLVMGRVTWESIGRPLPGRRTVVVTRDRAFRTDYPEVLIAHSLHEALDTADGLQGDVMVVGGGEVYAQALPLATHMVLTEVAMSPDGDAFFPDFDESEWRVVKQESAEGCRFVWWERW